MKKLPGRIGKQIIAMFVCLFVCFFFFLFRSGHCSPHGFNKGIHVDVIVYSFAHLHTSLLIKENLLGIY